MKKLLLFTLTVLLFGACSDDDNKNEDKVALIKLDNISSGVFVGGEYQLKVTHSPSDLAAPAYTWESSDTSIATVDNTGKLKALKEGKTIIKVTAEALTSSLEVSVLPVQATSIKFNQQEKELKIGESFALTYTIAPENTTNRTVTWKSSDENVITVSQYGVATAASDGNAVITVYLGSLKDECKIKVSPIGVTGIQLDAAEVDIEISEAVQLTATITPDNAKNKNIRWSSSDENIAAVSNTGLVTAKALGDAIITATSEDGGLTASTSIYVYNFTSKITVLRSMSSVTTPAGTTVSITGQLKNDSKKTIIAKKLTVYEDGVLLDSKDLDDTIKPGGDISYGIKRNGNFSFVYEYEYNGTKYTVSSL